jgi:hypothetical protein
LLSVILCLKDGRWAGFLEVKIYPRSLFNPGASVVFRPHGS